MGSLQSQWTTRIARWLYALPLAGFGTTHLLMGGELTSYVPKFIPGGVFWVYFTGAAFLAASVAFIVERRAHLAGLLLAAMFLTFVLTVDLPRLFTADSRGAAIGAVTNLLIDLAFAGGALLLAGRYSSDGVSEDQRPGES